MAFVLNDRVKETTTTTGTGTINLAGAESGFESFVSGIGDSNTCYYTIAHQTANEFEVGLGTVTDASPDTLARTTIISSSNSDSAVDFSAGTKDVFCTLPASKAIAEDGSGNLAIDISGIINLDADNGGNVNLKDGGTLYGTFQKENNDLRIISIVQDGDIILRGNDGGSYVDALTLDMSNSGDAVFRRQITLREALYINTADNSATTAYLYDNSGDFVLRSFTQDKDIVFKGNDGGSIIDALTLDMSSAGAAVFNSTVSHKGSTASSASNFISSWNNTGQSYNGYLYADSGGAGIFSHSSAAIQEGIYFQNSTDKTLFYNQATARGEIDGSGNMIMAGNITAYGSVSDIKLKENIEVIDNAVDKVKQLKGVTYTLKSDGQKLTGLIAQDLEKVLPEAVYETTDVDDDDKHLAIRYGNTVGLLVEAIKEQQEQIETLTAKVKELEDK